MRNNLVRRPPLNATVPGSTMPRALTAAVAPIRRGGRVVDRGGLLSRYTG